MHPRSLEAPNGVPAETAQPLRADAGVVLACQALPLTGCPGDLSPVTPAVSPSVSGPSSWLNITPSPYPSVFPDPRSGAMMAYDPDTESSLVYGGYGYGIAIYNDTWSVTAGNWTPLLSSSQCTNATCPTARVSAGFAYDLADHEAVLFGGVAVGTTSFVQFGDTWVFSGDHWTNITASAGVAPSPRFGVAMTYASSEGYVLLFGGAALNGTYYSDTWTFVHGKWTNITLTLSSHPLPRADAAIADSPTGYTMLFGGGDAAGYIQNAGGCPYIMWWFAKGQWTPAATGTCVALPQAVHGNTNSSDGAGPCGRDSAVLAWSPANGHFMLSGGETASGNGCPVTGTNIALNDTYEYLAAAGGSFSNWQQDLSPGGPTDRSGAGYASDYRDGYVIEFGGSLETGGLTNDTWRYIAVVQASLKGPLVLVSSTTSYSFPLFTLTGFGGSGYLNYEFNVTGLKTPNTLTGNPDCGNFTDHGIRGLPTLTGMVITSCAPDPGAYNVYRLSVSVWDSQKPTAHAYANWTFTADPPESVVIHSEFSGTFYTNVSFTNTFSIYAEIDNAPVYQMTATLGSFTSFLLVHDNTSAFWWQTTYNMGSASPTAGKLVVTASTTNWNETATLPLSIVSTPSFLLTFINFPGVVQTSTTSGAGPFNESYSVSQSVSVSLAKLFNFTLPSQVPLINGIYNLLPSIKVATSESSTGKVTLSGTLTETPPAISFGAFSLTISASLQLTGTLSLTAKNGVETIDWVSASMTITIKGDFKGNFPIWGYTFDILGNPVTIGFSLTVDLAPSIALQIVMVPADKAADSLADGMNFMVTQLVGSLSLPLTVSINFGIGVASVSAGGTIAVAVNFEINPPPFVWSNIWVNGTVVLSLTILFWSTSWNLVGPANIYHGTPPIPLGPSVAAPSSTYDNGSGAVWSVNARAYNTSGYDHLVWNAANSSGAAITDIYPHAGLSAVSTYGGAYLFYTDDRVDLPVQDGLTVSGLGIDSSSNAATALPLPTDPGYLVSAPKASARPDGAITVVWDALPTSEAVGASPSAVTQLDLHGATYFPANRTWGPIRDLTTGGFAQSYAVDASGTTPIASVLVSEGLIVTATSPEQLETFNVDTGALLAQPSATGFSTVGSIRSDPLGNSPGQALLATTTGNWTEFNLGSGGQSFLPFTAPANATLVEEKFVAGAASPTVLERYRQPSSELVVLFDPGTGLPDAEWGVAGNVVDAEALGTSDGGYDVYVSNGTGFAGVQFVANAGSSFLRSISASGAGAFGLAQVGGSLLLYGLVPAAGGGSGEETLFLAEVAVGLPTLAAGAPTAPSSGSSPPTGASAGFNSLLYLGVPVAAAAAVLVLLAVWPKRRAPAAAPLLSPDHVTAPPAGGPPPG